MWKTEYGEMNLLQDACRTGWGCPWLCCKLKMFSSPVIP